MKSSDINRVKSLLDRIARVSTSQDWGDNLNPVQRAVLSYLSIANKFSKTPSIIAEYMCTTRGTTSQTLKALGRKELVFQSESPIDRRSISYEITALGLEALNVESGFDAVLENVNQQKTLTLLSSLESIAHRLLAVRGFKPFGICKDCKYLKNNKTDVFCSLLKIELTQKQVTQLCHEQIPIHVKC
jgi:DNA-binding MarR family transcriptional regulator